MKKFLKKAIKENWHKHFGVAFVIQILACIFISDFSEDLRLFEQILVTALVWYLGNFIFEWFQKFLSGHKSGMKVMHYDSLAAVVGGVFGVILYNLF